MLREIPSLSRLLDVHLTAEVVEGKVDSLDDMLSVTVSIPTDEYHKLCGQDVELLYVRPMLKALAESINELGKVKVGVLPLPKGEAAFSCTKGKVPVMLRLVRRVTPDRYQLLMHTLVQKVD